MRHILATKPWFSPKRHPRWWIGVLTLLCAIDLIIIGFAIVARMLLTGFDFSIADLGPLVLAAGVLVALMTLLHNKQREASGDFLKSAVDLLAKSYDVLARQPQDTRDNRRLNWLTSARLLSSAEFISTSITEDSHLRIWNNEREYWRARFRDLILSTTDFPQDFFSEKPEHLNGRDHQDASHLSHSSLAVLYRFVQWQDEA